MELPNNYLKYPENVMTPKVVPLQGYDYKVYSYRFRGIQDFYDFLKKNPDVNYTVFPKGKLSSIHGERRFAGKPYYDALEDLTKEMDPGYQEYLQVQKQIQARGGRAHRYRPIKSVAGGSVDPVAYSTGSPEIYRASRLYKRPKFLTIDTQIAYNCGHSKAQVFNRAVIITSLIRALERNGYSVDVNSFMVAVEDDEVIESVFEIKRQGHSMNYQALYKSLVDVEFFRRLCFRLIEISNVQNEWSYGYGSPAYESMVRELLNLKKEDIYFDQPSDMGIRGKDIGDDFAEVVDSLQLQNYINVSKEIDSLRRSVKVLQK